MTELERLLALQRQSYDQLMSAMLVYNVDLAAVCLNGIIDYFGQWRDDQSSEYKKTWDRET
jgi:hypothetical protein